MEEQLITTTTKPRITLKKSPLRKCELGWEIVSSSSKDKAELKLIVEMITEVNGDMEKAFVKIKEKKE